MQRAFLISLLLFFCLQGKAQTHVEEDTSRIVYKRDLIDVFRKWFGKDPFTASEEKKRDSTKLSFSIIPAFGVAGAEKGVVTSMNAAFFLGPRQTTNLSNVYFTPYFTFSNQLVIPVRSYIWTANNAFNFIGDYRYMIYPQELYSIYDYSKNKPESRLHYNQVRFYQTCARGILPNTALGLGILYDRYVNVREEEIYIDGVTSFQKYGDTADSYYTSCGPSLELIVDSRRNTLNPKQGTYLRLTYRMNQKWLGSAVAWNSLYLDARKYFKISDYRRKTLALWFLGWSVFGQQANYLDLPSIGWDFYGKTGRGVYRNRYRSSSILYFETEYRTEITDNGLWGMVFFANITSPAKMFTHEFTRPNFSVGSGLRLRLNKRTGGNVGMDFGFSQGYWTYYLTLNEFF